MLFSRIEDGAPKNAIYKALNRVIVNANEFKVYLYHGVIYVKCYHFYGVNTFRLVRMNSTGWGYKRSIRRGCKLKKSWKGKILSYDLGVKSQSVQPEFWRKNIDAEHTPKWDYYDDDDDEDEDGFCSEDDLDQDS